ncbi:class I SAM-dependent methyltransferase [Paenibacillus dendritiformis]|uniref:class I SAM-dependent methyltransferase n=1 Tax=Paenibacillus dendritiformis TaxID=130049 RepID=UPI00387E155B
MNHSISADLAINKKSWDSASERFFGRNALPDYGPYAPSEEKLQLFGDVSGLKTLEIGCGSGHSMKYMLSRRVKEAWGIDLSRNQIDAAHQVLGWTDSPYLFESPMEVDPGLPHHYFDIVYSIYAIGWTLDFSKTLVNIYNYLKPGGTFIFSWEHSFHSRIAFREAGYQFVHSYHDESVQQHEAWKPTPAMFHFRRISTFINELIHSGFTIEHIVEDIDPSNEAGNKNPAAWYSDVKAELYPATMIIKSKKR